MQRHGYELGYTTSRLHLQKTGAVQAAPKRGAANSRALYIVSTGD